MQRAYAQKMRQRRPVFLNLARIRYPIGAMASIGHRLSGIVLLAALPFAALALDRSFSSEARFEELLGTLQSGPGRAAMVLLAWACAHHLLAGLRHLLSDIGIGASLAASRRSAWLVLIAALAFAAAASALP